MQNFTIKDNNISLDDIYRIINNNLRLKLDPRVTKKVNNARKFLEKKIKKTGKKFYGINTGFGDLHNVRINDEDLSDLQHNLIKSHACGTGEKVNDSIVKLMLLLKIIHYQKVSVALESKQ